uniref:Rv1815 family serine proteinase n=1 Tax=Mycolicibacterium madagascariense TaxID=212765 RepID=UPI001FE96A43|nr:S1 family peptidase [Mycolicibacterium madagascariense]
MTIGAAALLAAATAAGPVAGAAPGAVVAPGMEIRQDTTKCTLGFVDVQTRTAFTAGHCRGNGVVGDKDGNVVGHQTDFRDDTPNGATISTDHMISDWETIALAPDAQVTDVLPGGRALVFDPSVTLQQGERVCHFGVATGESCGTVDAVNNGWFTMTNGVVSQRGDSGGPVYVLTDDGRAVIVGMFNSTWGQYPAAVSWTSTETQIHQDVYTPAAATVAPPPPA